MSSKSKRKSSRNLSPDSDEYYSNRKSQSSRTHKASKTKDEKYEKEHRTTERRKDFEIEENYSHQMRKFNKKNKEFNSEDRTNMHYRKNESSTDARSRKERNEDFRNYEDETETYYRQNSSNMDSRSRKEVDDFRNFEGRRERHYKDDESSAASRYRKGVDDFKHPEERHPRDKSKDMYKENEKYKKDADSLRKIKDHSNHKTDSSLTGSHKRRHDSLENSNEDAFDDTSKRDSDFTSTQKDDSKKLDDAEPLSKRQKIDNINMRTGGAYIPPARLRMMQEKIQDKGSEQYQRLAWEALKKSIVGMTNKVNSSNIAEIIPELFKENIIRGRGVLARAIMQAQAASPTFTRVYAALVAIINSKFPQIGELILKRLIIQYKRGFRRNDKTFCMTAARFIAHLLNQEVAHEVLILEVITHLLENPTEDSVEVAIATLKECGKKLTQLTSRGMRAIAQRVRDVLHEGKMDMRVHYMIEVFFAVQKDGFKDFEIMPQELDLVEEEDKYTHLINLDDAFDGQDMLNVFKFDPEYLENEEKYKAVVKEILGDSSDEEDSGDESDDEEEEESAEQGKDDESQQIIDMTETNIVCLRRKIYLTVQSSLDFEECAHKLLKLELKPGQILEMCYMILDCCAQQRTYEKFFGLLAQRFCQLSKVYVEPFTEIFENSYKTIHRLETNKLRNVAKFFAHLLYTDAISWMVLSNIKLNEEDTTSSSRIFIKILFQELCEYMGLPKLNDRVKDITLQEAFDGLFPRDHPHNTRFAINFFTSIGLGGLTDELREHLKNLPKTPAPIEPTTVSSPKESSSSDSSSSSSSSSTTTSSSSSSSSSSDAEENNSKHKKQRRKKR